MNKGFGKAEKVFPPGKCVVVFGEFPITIMLPSGTLLEQKEILRQRIKFHADSLYESKIWDSPVTEDELNECLRDLRMHFPLTMRFSADLWVLGYRNYPPYPRIANENALSPRRWEMGESALGDECSERLIKSP